jgi:hypothetical protein
MVALASELLESDLLAVSKDKPSIVDKLLSILKDRSLYGRGHESCLLVCTGPGDLVKVLTIPGWRKRFKFLAAWIIDSFWLEHMPATFIRLLRPFDHLFITSGEDVDQWKDLTGAPVTWVPWGTDALRFGGGDSCRDWDVTRVGRQPPEWEDDAAVSAAALSLGIKYRGRPTRGGLSTLQNQEFLMGVYRNSKYLLAFSNSVNPESYTHPTRQYLTGRWVDALACGATVAGVPPRGPSIDELLWPGATLDLGSIRRKEGLEILATALRRWTPEMAIKNNVMALKKLDWRWRFKVIADVFGTYPIPLANELRLLQQRLAISPVT